MYQYEKIPFVLSKKYEETIVKIEELKDTLQIPERDLKSLILDDVPNQVKIEGNALQGKEITYFLSEDVTIRGKKFRDFVQTKNEDFSGKLLREQLKRGDFKLSEASILFLHRLVTSGELNEDESGYFRKEPVHIRYTSYIPPMAELVPDLIKELVMEYNAPMFPEKFDTRFERICEWKRNFERIHPFIDGNGRTGRLIMNLLFLQNGYGYVQIPLEERDLYFASIENNTLHEFLAPKMLATMEAIREKQLDYTLPEGR